MDLFAVMEDIDENLQRKSVRHEGRHTGSRVWLFLFSGVFFFIICVQLYKENLKLYHL